MKTTILCFFVTFVFAAHISSAQILIGPTAGLNYSWTSFGDKELKDRYSVSPVPGYHVGGHLSFKVRKRFFLHTSVLYSTKGKLMKSDEQDLRLKAQYNYIEMPLIYTAYFKGSIGRKEFKYSLGIGPNVSYWLGGSGTVENTDTHEFHNSSSVVTYDINFDKHPSQVEEHDMIVSEPNRIQLGLNLAAGFLFEPAPNREVVLTIRYELGHSFLSRTSDGVFGPTYFEDPMRIRNQGFRVSLAYLIDLKVEERKKGKSTIKKKQLKRGR